MGGKEPGKEMESGKGRDSKKGIAKPAYREYAKKKYEVTGNATG